MTKQTANTIAIGCATLAALFALKMAGLFGMSTASGGSGFWVFFVYMSSLLLGFVIFNDFVVKRPEVVSPKWKLVHLAIIAIVFSPQIFDSLAEYFGWERSITLHIRNFYSAVSDYVHLIWLAPPAILFGKIFVSTRNPKYIT